MSSFFFRIDRNHGNPLPQASFHLGVNVVKLRIAVGMVGPLLGLAIALQAVVQIVQKVSDLGMADGVALPT